MRVSDSLISSPHTSRETSVIISRNNSKSFLSSAVLDLLCWIEITDQGAERLFGGVRVREVVARLNCYQIGKGGFIFNIVRLEQGGKKACLSMVDKLTTVQ